MSDCGCAYEVLPGGVHPERRYFHEPNCPLGPPPQPVRDLAQAIADGEAFTDADAVRVARAYLDEGGETA